jgi:GntR family transcriptional repressor for pyruvate dehydrogenase complex
MTSKKIFTGITDKTPLSKKIADEIEKAILNKKLIVGDKLPSEHELCEQFGVSRTSVREAVKILITQDIVEVKKGHGIFVKSISPENITEGIIKFYRHMLNEEYAMDLIHARQALEPSIAYYAALNRSEEDLKIIEQNIILLKKHNKNPKKSAEFDLKFHDSLAVASRNNLFVFMMRPLHNLIPPIKSKIHKVLKGSTDLALEWHDKIFEAVKDKKPELAKLNMIEHLKIAEKQIKEVYEKKQTTKKE